MVVASRSINMNEHPELLQLDPWLCFCGSILEEWDEHIKVCAPYNAHRDCICRGGGAYWPHDPRPGSKDHVAIFASCVPCGLRRIPFEAPSRVHATEYTLWCDMVVQPRVDEVQRMFECPHQSLQIEIAPCYIDGVALPPGIIKNT